MTRFERQRRRLFLTILVLCVLLTGLCTVAYAKYIYNEQKGGTVTITAQLGTITLQESKAVKAADGSYALTDEKVSANAYFLMPGVDVPKDPRVEITKPNNIPVYVYIKMDTNIPADSGVVYQLESCWKPVAGFPGVYVYAEAGQAKAVTDDMQINVLAIPAGSQHEIRVSQNLKLTEQVKLDFTAYMYQTAAGNTAEEVYQHYNP